LRELQFSIPGAFDENHRAGDYSVVWDGRNDENKVMASGIYYYALKIGERLLITKKMILLKRQS
jgi:hypothetical protein